MFVVVDGSIYYVDVVDFCWFEVWLGLLLVVVGLDCDGIVGVLVVGWRFGFVVGGNM